MNMLRYAGLLMALILSLGARQALAQDELPKDPSSQPAKRTGPADTSPKLLQSPEIKEPPAPPPGSMVDQPVAMLQGLDKITARVRRLEVKVGQAIPFGTLSVEVDACRKSPAEDSPESAAFLKITDSKPGEKPQQIFSGWMFASSPALSALDHPVYDIWVLECTSDPRTSPAAPN
jgi:hypothetical protein